jgi:hypothetical protein
MGKPCLERRGVLKKVPLQGLLKGFPKNKLLNLVEHLVEQASRLLLATG